MLKKNFMAAFPEVSSDDTDLCFRLMYGDRYARGFPKDEELPENTRAWLKKCHNRPPKSELALEAINEIIGGHGTEGIYSTRWIDSYHCDVRGAYVNMGDVYATTILRDHQLSRWWLTSLGDFAAWAKGLK